jgi:hypothetical protein
MCAGFLLRTAANNIGVRIAAMKGRFDPNELSDAGERLWSSYRTMAIGNGVDPQDPLLARCRADDE